MRFTIAKIVRTRGQRTFNEKRSGRLFVVAGIPNNIATSVEGWLKSQLDQYDKIVVHGSSKNDANIYSDGYNDILINALSDIVIKRRNSPQQNITPSAIFFLFIPTPDCKKILELLDFCVFPIPLNELSVWNDFGKMRRHSENAIRKSLDRNIISSSAFNINFSCLKNRIDRLSSDEELLLPPVNFHYLEVDVRLREEFKKFRNGENFWSVRIKHLKKHRLGSEDISNIEYNRKISMYSDIRELLFRISEPNERHGPPRQVEADASREDKLLTLRSLYRFGAPIPSGLHHDLQFIGKVPLVNISLDCAKRGRIERSGSHAPVYPNDVVR